MRIPFAKLSVGLLVGVSTITAYAAAAKVVTGKIPNFASLNPMASADVQIIPDANVSNVANSQEEVAPIVVDRDSRPRGDSSVSIPKNSAASGVSGNTENMLVNAVQPHNTAVQTSTLSQRHSIQGALGDDGGEVGAGERETGDD